MISNIDTIIRIPPSPPRPKPMLSLILKYGIAEETNKDLNVLTEKKMLIQDGRITNMFVKRIKTNS